MLFMVVLTMLKAGIFGETTSEGVPHSIFLYCATVPRVFFQNSLTFATISLTLNMHLVKKIYFPREFFPFSVVLAYLMDFVIALTLVGGMMAYGRLSLTTNILWLPALMAVELGFVLSLGLFASASNVFYRDVQYLIPLGTQLWFFASPVFYAVNQVPAPLRGWYLLNPMAVVIDGFRRAILHGTGPELGPLLVCVGIVGSGFVLAYRSFKRVESKFADFI